MVNHIVLNMVNNIFLESFFAMAEKDLCDSMYRLDDFLSRVDHEMNGVCFLELLFQEFIYV